MNRQKPPLIRFMEHIQVTRNCWNWTGSKTDSGYGIFSNRKPRYKVHRYSYEIFVGKIPTGLTIDHLCRNRLCVNPSHLEPVARSENVMRGIGHGAVNIKKTHCPSGHPYSGKNLMRLTWNGRPYRKCRTCSGWKGLKCRKK